MKMQTLIVDDEKLARDKLQRLLGEEQDINIVGECASGNETVDFPRSGLSFKFFSDSLIA